MKRAVKCVFEMFLVISFLLPTGCKKKESRNRIVKESDPYYSCEEVRLSFDFLESEEKKLKARSFGMTKIFSDCVLSFVSDQYVMPDGLKEKYEQRYSDLSLSEEDRQRIQDEYASYQRRLLVDFGLDGTIKCYTDIPSNSEIIGMIEDLSGTPKVVVSSYSADYQMTATLCEISPKGELINGITLEHELIAFGGMFFLENGNILCSDSSSVLLFGSDGKLLHEEALFVPIEKLFQIDGKYYAYTSTQDLYDDTTPPASYMFEIDPVSGKKVGEKLDVTGKVHGSKLIQGYDGLYATTGTGIQKYDLLSEKKSKKILSWSETDCNYFNDFVHNPSYSFVSDNDIYLACWSFEGLSFERVNDPSSAFINLMHLHREEKNPHAGKNILYLAFIGDLRKDVKEYINAYNLDQTKKTRIVIEDYSGDSNLYTPMVSVINPSTEEQSRIADQVYLEILSGDGPDILLNFGSFSQFNTERALLDLNTLIDGSSPLDRSLLFDNVLRAYESDGKLYQLPLNFAVTGMLANVEYVGERNGWTYEEFQNIDQSLPDGISILGNISQSDLLEALMRGSTRHLLDYNNKEVKLNAPEFANILNLVKKYGNPKSNEEILEDMMNSETAMDNEQRFDAGMIVAMNWTVHKLSEFGEITSYCNGNTRFIGNPSIDGTGAMADEAASVAISKTCSSRDDAWDFIKCLFEEDIQVSSAAYNNNFPVNRNAFETIVDLSFESNKIARESGITTGQYAPQLIDLREEHVTALLEVIEGIRESCSYDPSAMMIIQEEAPGYFCGQRTVDEVVNNIQKRSKAVVQERG